MSLRSQLRFERPCPEIPKPPDPGVDQHPPTVTDL
jgi:hypothetical protein